MKLRKGMVVKKRTSGGTRRMRVSAVFGTGPNLYAELLPLASSGARTVVRLDEDGLPEGYEVAK